MRYLLFLLITSLPAQAETIVATTVVRSGTVLTPAHIAIVQRDTPGAARSMEEVLGKETRVNLYPNRSISLRDVGMPRVVGRNDPVALIYQNGGLRIEAEGRALGVAGIGERVRVINSSSRQTVHGIVTSAGIVEVQ